MMELADKQKQMKIAEINYNILRVEVRLMQLDEEKIKLNEQIDKHKSELDELNKK